MALVEWNDEWSVAITELDDQHKKLINVLNSLFSAMNEGRGQELLGSIFDEVLDYTKYHFSYEELLLAQCNYPEYDDHKAAHDNLLKDTLTFKMQYENKTVLGSRILRFLEEWIVQHICFEDKKYAPYLIQNHSGR